MFVIGDGYSEKGEGRESEHRKRKTLKAPKSSRGGSHRTKLCDLRRPVQIQHNFIFDLHFPYFPELWAVYRVRRIFALTWSNPVLWEPPKVSQGLREFQKPHFQSTVGLFALLLWVLMLEELNNTASTFKALQYGNLFFPPSKISCVVKIMKLLQNVLHCHQNQLDSKYYDI